MLKRLMVAVMLAHICASTGLAADPTITVSAKQRYPWNGLVDLQFTITGDAGTKYDTSFTVKDMIGGTNIMMATIRKADGTAANVASERLLPSNYHWIWDAAADLPKGWKCDRVTVTGTTEYKPLYMVIDLSSGSSSSSYPVSYLDDVPTGGWSDEYKTTKLVLRRIEPGTFKMGGQYTVTLTKPFYIGVFEVTQRQWELVMGTKPSYFSNVAYYATRPVEQVSWNMIRGVSSTYHWPSSMDVDANSFIGRIMLRTGPNFDLPTEAQWEYACRAGTITDFNNGKNRTGGDNDANLNEVGRYRYNGGLISGSSIPNSGSTTANGSSKVGTYRSNEWGLYDMHGNVWEACLDWYGTLTSDDDPVGPSSGTYRVRRGGCWDSIAEHCIASDRHNASPSDGTRSCGFRLARTILE